MCSTAKKRSTSVNKVLECLQTLLLLLLLACRTFLCVRPSCVSLFMIKLARAKRE
ncbi:unnamed protein product, partial [Trichogramma brassicae]